METLYDQVCISHGDNSNTGIGVETLIVLILSSCFPGVFGDKQT